MKRDYITQLWEAAAEFAHLSSYNADPATWKASKEKLEALLKKCPKCGAEVSTRGGHGAWCPNENCKWGWEVELNGFPLESACGEGGR